MKKVLVCLFALFLFQAVLHGQAVPSDSMTLQMGGGPAQPANGHMQVQWNQNGQGVDQSQEGYVIFNLSAFPAGLTGANVQKATLTLFVDGGGQSGMVTICQVASPWSSATAVGTSAPTCVTSGPNVKTYNVTIAQTQLQNGSFILQDITAIVQNWLNGQPNYGIKLAANGPMGGVGNGVNVQFDAMQNSGQGNPPTLNLVLQSQGPVGPMGPQGPQGPAGATGATGAVGPQGPKGDTGATGATGPQGAAGATGATGAAGTTGPQGPSGPTGPAGPQGQGFTVLGPYNPGTTYSQYSVVTEGGSSYVDIATSPITGVDPANDVTNNSGLNWKLFALAGATGATGAQGPQGQQGLPGLPGAQGPQGSSGPAGPQGPQGPAGATGATGAVGPQGPKGDAGATGATGPQGAAGANGATGATGSQGPSGPTGPAGPQGQGFTFIGPYNSGTTYSQYSVVTEGGSSYVDIATSPITGIDPANDVANSGGNWKLFALAGATGATGAPGPQGEQGPAGLPGGQGPQGSQGPQGPAGATGATGAAGPQGPSGPIGPAGPQGQGFTFIGPYNSGTTYSQYSVVTEGGSSYVDIATSPITGIDPANDVTNNSGLNWKLFAQVGTTGATGAQGPQGEQGLAGLPGAPGAQGPQGPSGPQGPAGATGVTGATGAQGPAGPQGPAGTTGATGATGAAGPQGPAGATGATGAVGPQGPSGPTGPQGAAGASAYAGIWSPATSYTQGQMVLRTAGIGSPGPFFALALSPTVGLDPAADSTEWAYCCGTATLGYTPFSSTGAMPTSYSTGSSQTLLSYTFNADDAQTISTLSVSVSGLAGAEACFKSNGSPTCASIGFPNETGCTGSGQNFVCPVPAAAMTVVLSRNGMTVAMGTINADGTFTPPASFSVTYNAGDTLTLKVMNASSTVTDTVTSGTWSL